MSGVSNGGGVSGTPRRPFVRLWWATLPYEGWTWYDAEETGAVPCPWWAHPIAWVHRLLDLWVDPWK